MDYVKILRDAYAAVSTAERASGCGRVYVCIADKKHRAGIKAAAKKLGKTYQTEAAYGFKYVLYVGYDNNTGVELGKGTKIANMLVMAGIDAFREEAGD